MKDAMVNFMKDAIMVSQVRAARALLDWSREELGRQAGTTERTIARVELAEGPVRRGTLDAIRAALEAAGVVFLSDGEIAGGGPGVRLKGGAE
jgi:transcriptional regulator with XRE-family HTH domain